MTEKEIAWDLSEIFPSIKHPDIDKTMDTLSKEADHFVINYKGKIITPEFNSQDLLTLFKGLEEFGANIGEIGVFANNSFNANMTLPTTQALNNKFREFTTQVSKKLAFIDLEIGKLVSEKKDIASDPALINYKHYIEKVQRAFPHKLSEVEEQLILEKDQHGIKAWSQLQGSWLNTRQFKVNVEGQEKILSYGEANSLFTHPDRNTRISANKAIYGLLGKDEDIFSTALRNICADWVKNSKRRNFSSPMHQSLISNDITQDIIGNLMNNIKESVEIYRRYLRNKAKLLKLTKLNNADMMAHLLKAPTKKYTWEETKKLVLQVFSNFDPQFEEYVKDMFDRNHIDASTRQGKRNGAYCDGWYNGKTTFILLSFTGTINEIFTLTHELGHAIHGYLSSRTQTYFNYHPGSSMAEVASIFAELIMTDHLLNEADSNKEKISILAHVLDEAGQAAFQVSARVWFEKDLYSAIERGKHLDGKTISKYWMKGRDNIYGDVIDWLDEMPWEWTMKPHYYFPNSRFYNYPYVFAQLFVYALYQKFKEEGKNFMPKFKRLLSAGGSLSPEELARIVGLDITKYDFWKLGLKQFEEFVDQLENLMK